jgi:hypothetical protein
MVIDNFITHQQRRGGGGERRRLSEHVGTSIVKARGSGERWCKVVHHTDRGRERRGRRGEKGESRWYRNMLGCLSSSKKLR